MNWKTKAMYLNIKRSLLKYTGRFILLLILFAAGYQFSSAQDYQSIKEDLEIQFDGDASIEVGGPYAGLEFHHSSPVIRRVSFYYPVANSIDLSTDYWTRDEFQAMSLGLKIGDQPRERIGKSPFKTTQTPYEVTFRDQDERRGVEVSYRFSGQNPYFVISYRITNRLDRRETFVFDTDLQASIHTSHTYKIVDQAWSEYHKENQALIINFEDPETLNTRIFTMNAGEPPTAFSTRSTLDSLPAPKDWWDREAESLNGELIPRDHPDVPAFRYEYQKALDPGQTLEVVQIVGTAKKGETSSILADARRNHEREVKAYEEHILQVIRDQKFKTGDPYLDHSVMWSHGILEANQHYIDGSIQPMPCPAQYNFYFTHDVLLTDLSRVNYDLPRVKKDLEFIIQHADSNHVIPHAYYWKDLDYATEIAPPDNWNHFWFVITAASYLRHSGDEEFARQLYPYIEQSVKDFQQHKKDNVIYSYRPDWWDIAWNFGPRSYTTLLANKALREFTFIASILGENETELKKLEANTDQLQKGLNEKLWSEEQDYLINYFEDGSLDSHYYIGSLLGSHYDLLSEERKEKLVATASNKIYDPKIGVYMVYPMDFHKLIDYLKLNGNEAGDPYYYMNGGIWPHGNAWYALALMESGKNEEALEFIRNIMTVKGVMDSPNGQPAMYEYRVSKKSDPEVYGKIDKPQFTWAAGWYLYSLYNLYGVKENEWNIRFEPYLPDNQEKAEFVLTAGGKDVKVHLSGKGTHVSEIRFDGKPQYSTVLPYTLTPAVESIEIRKGELSKPILTNLDAVLQSATYSEANKEMIVSSHSFEGHQVTAVIETPFKVKDAKLHNSDRKVEWQVESLSDNTHELRVKFVQGSDEDSLSIVFE